MFRIQLLGGFSLVHEGVRLAGINAARLQSLTAYLVLHRQTPQPRSRLASLFWPESNEDQAHTNLRKLIHQLRKAIPEADDFIRAEGKTIQLNSEAEFELDVADFEQSIKAGDFQRAVTLYQGDLLPECYEDWVCAERERLRQGFITAMEKLIAQLESRREYRAAIDYAQRLLRSEPLREEIYCQLMHLYALDGDRGGVTRTYDACVAVLHDELSVGPSAATRQAYQKCLLIEPSDRPVTILPSREKTNLPIGLSSFIGRTREIAEVRLLLKSSRLLTLTGAGGCGKTRLAMQAASDSADRYPDGVTWVDFAKVSNPELVPQAISSALGLSERPDCRLTEVIADYLTSNEVLLLLDNCEHLITACAQLVGMLLRTCPRLQVLTTSREALNIAGETVWTVPSLSTPDVSKLVSYGEAFPVETVTSYDAVGLFVERAATAFPAFQLNKQTGLSIAKICHRLDGIPLAIELAAARVKVMSVDQIDMRLNDRFGLLVDGSRISLPRHQTLKATLDWSYELLSGPERILFRRLAVFTGNFSLEAAEAVCAGWQCEEDLSLTEAFSLFLRLVEKSLIVIDSRARETRYRLLETIREYARNKLREAGELERARNRHLDYYRDLLETFEPKVQIIWPSEAYNQLNQEYANLLEALEWSATGGANAESGLRLASALSQLFYLWGHVTLGRNLIEKLLAMGGSALSKEVRAKAYISLGVMAQFQCDVEVARTSFERSLELYRDLDAKLGIAHALMRLGYITAAGMNDLANGRRYFEESLNMCRALGDRYGITPVLINLGYVHLKQGEKAYGRGLIEESLTLLRELGVRHWIVGQAILFLGRIAQSEGDYERAHALLNESVGIFKEFRVPLGFFYALEWFGYLAVAEAQYDRAARMFGAAERISQEIGTSLLPSERSEHDVCVGAVRAAIGESVCSVAWAAGRALTLDQAIAYALAEDEKK